MHVYVFWRAASIPFVEQHISRKIFIGTGLILWAIFFWAVLLGIPEQEFLQAFLSSWE
jgi:hypothetical protein